MARAQKLDTEEPAEESRVEEAAGGQRQFPGEQLYRTASREQFSRTTVKWLFFYLIAILSLSSICK